ncbi:hypothetical protein PoB_006348100 [Plakobranchus ocellatus]|uniref:Uncharacterized protein n=1 Tax=Plakobranchus ocellatus TaxID=259542 RepID=A0AAV4CZ13_9GAST|nr:hypothetical protein PoB_006348100 [Plakobranchus ocellatus]
MLYLRSTNRLFIIPSPERQHRGTGASSRGAIHDKHGLNPKVSLGPTESCPVTRVGSRTSEGRSPCGVGRSSPLENIGKYGIGTRNENGEKFSNTGIENDLMRKVIFQQKRMHKET